MTTREPSFGFGIEEEYFLVDRTTRDLAELPADLLARLEARLGKQFSTEFMRAQIEIATPVCTSAQDARGSLMRSRRLIGYLLEAEGLAPIASATHPFARWREQRHTQGERYDAVAEDLQDLGRRTLVNGLHVHVGIDDDELRIELMNELRRFMPVLLALSTSSPFWQGEATGLKSYRTAINSAQPRKGMPERWEDWPDYERTVDVLVRAGAIDDASKIWWDLRPSSRFPTLEMRIADICPLVEDAISIAALFRCLCRCFYRRRSGAPGQPAHPLLLINENRWRAQRHGMDEGLIDLDNGRVTAFPDVLDAMLEMIAEDAAHFDCAAEVAHARSIVERGTSADRQLARYQRLRAHGMSRKAALMGVVDLLIEETTASTALSRRTGRMWKHPSLEAAASAGRPA